MMIEDWEIGMLYFNCLKMAKDDEGVKSETSEDEGKTSPVNEGTNESI